MLETAPYPGPDGQVTVHIAKPDGAGPFPAVVLAQELFGITDFMLDSARLLARQGYVVLVPDLYSNDAAFDRLTIPDMENAIRVAFSPDAGAAMAQIPDEEKPAAQQAVAWLQTVFTRQSLMPDLLGAVAYAKTRSDVRGDAVALLGFCMGGGLVGQALAHGAPVKAGVVFYGQLPKPEQAADLNVPFLGHFGGNDAFVNSGLPAFTEALKAAGKPHEVHVYEGAEHAFCNFSRQSFHPAAASLAWRRTYEFLAKNLK